MLESTKIVREILSGFTEERRIWDVEDIMTAINITFPNLFILPDDHNQEQLAGVQNNTKAFREAINKVVKSFKLKVSKSKNDAQLLLGLDIDTEYIQHYYFVEDSEGNGLYVPIEKLTEYEWINIYQNGKAKEHGQRKWNEEHAYVFELKFGKKIEDAIKSASQYYTAN